MKSMKSSQFPNHKGLGDLGCARTPNSPQQCSNWEPGDMGCSPGGEGAPGSPAPAPLMAAASQVTMAIARAQESDRDVAAWSDSTQLRNLGK